MDLIDYLAYKPSELWKLVSENGERAERDVKALWAVLEESIPTQSEAVVGLNDLFLYSMYRIKQHSKKLADSYPTTQYTKNRLEKVEDLWWVDHYTAGVSEMSTLNWFSAAKLKKVNNVSKVAGASTHFVAGRSSIPYYIIPLMHGTWHEPLKNKDALSIEYVNPGGLTKVGDTWKYWASTVPASMLAETYPVQLGSPWYGSRYMLPFTLEQVKNSIKLKRLVMAALPGRLSIERFTDHNDWRSGKPDMGPLWPKEDINREACSRDPLPELHFLQAEFRSIGETDASTRTDPDIDVAIDQAANPEYGIDAPTHDDDATDTGQQYTTAELQQRLASKGYIVKVDGVFGPKTAAQVRHFQADWNRTNTKDRLKVDGIPGPRTMQRLRKD